MAILENVSTEAGDILRIKTETPIVGLISLSQFVDTTQGESEIDYFKKEFRYSVDAGLTFSEWIDLSLINISNVAISKYDSFVLEYKYTRVGETPEVDLSFEDILVSGAIEDLPYPIFKKSVFSDFFNINDLNVFGWAINVLEKLYIKGLILPDYINRGDDQSNLEDEDFITYWNSITHFFAIIVYFARQFHDFETNEILLAQFLKSKDLVLPTDATLTDLLYLYGPTPSKLNHTYIDEYVKRGTRGILDRVSAGNEIDGELIRLIRSESFEEFIFAMFRNFESGWCIGKSSPLWKGTEKIINLIKGYEFTTEIVDLSKYSLIQSDFISIIDDKMVIDSVGVGLLSGVGGTTKKITIDSGQDYEISFRVSQSIIENNLVFGVRVWNKDGIELGFKDVVTGVDTAYFFYQKSLNIVDTEYWIRGILYHNSINLTETPVATSTTLGEGNNLRIPTAATQIVPIIGVLGTGSANEVKIDNIKVRPLKLNFSRGQLGIHNLLYLVATNNNDELQPEQISEFIKEKLLPYNSFLKINWI